MDNEIQKKEMEQFELWREKQKARKLVKYLMLKKTLNKEKFWLLVKELDQGLKVLYPEEYMKIQKYIQEERRNKFNEYASDKNKTFRHVGAVPVSIWGTLKMLYGEELPYTPKKFQQEFTKRFPHYRIAQKI